MNPIEELTIWLEENRLAWRDRGADVLQHDGRTIFAVTDPNGNLTGECWVFVGPAAECDRWPPVEAEFVKLIVLGEISVEHSKILIEDAVGCVTQRWLSGSQCTATTSASARAEVLAAERLLRRKINQAQREDANRLREASPKRP